MVKKTPKQDRQVILQLWLGGHTVRDVQEKTGISKSTVARVIQEYKEKIPSLETIRSFTLEVKESGQTIPELMHASASLRRLTGLGLGLSDLDEVVEFVKESKKGKIDVAAYIKAAAQLREMEKQHNLTAKEILHKLAKAASEFQDLQLLIRESEQTIGIIKSFEALKKRRDRLIGEVGALTKEKGTLERSLDFYRKVNQHVWRS